MIRVLLIAAMALAMGGFGTASAQEPVATAEAGAMLDPGVPLKVPKNATLTAIAPMPNTLIGWESEKRWGLKHGDLAPFYYARYRVNADTKTKKGGAKAGTDLYGVFYNAASGAAKHDGEWVVKPEWSGVFPLTSDNMLVRAAGTDTWYVLNTKSGSTTKLGNGRIGSINVVDREITGSANLYGDELYFLITQDDGETQTIQLMNWSKFGQKFTLRAPVDKVVPAEVLGESPVKATLRADYFIRRYGQNGKMYDFAVSDEKIENWPLKKFTTVEVSYPQKQAMFVLDADKQLYVPIEEDHSMATFYNAQGNNPTLLGYRPVGSGITTGLKDNPLEALADGIMAAVWDTPNGLRLAPLNGDWQGYFRSMDYWGLPDWEDGNIFHFNYMSPHRVVDYKSWAAFTELYPVDIPQEVHMDPDPALAWYNGVYGVYPNGKVDVYIARIGIGNGAFTRSHAEPFENMDAARAFVAEALTLEGRKAFAAFYEKSVADYQAKLAATERQKQEDERAAIQARIDADYAAMEAKGDKVKAMLSGGDYYGALNLAATGDTRYLPMAIVRTMDAGYGQIVTYELAEAGLLWANEREKTYCMNRMWNLRPAPSRSYQYGSTSSSSGSSSSAAPDTSQYDVMEAARQSSRDNYNSGNSSSYLCGSASFCN